MTQIRHDAPITRETSAVYRGRPLILEAHAGFVVLRPKGLKTATYSVDWSAVYEFAAKLYARRNGARV